MKYMLMLIVIITSITLSACQNHKIQDDGSMEALEKRIDELEQKLAESASSRIEGDPNGTERIQALQQQVSRLELQVQDLLFVTLPMRIQVIQDNGQAYWYGVNGRNLIGILPSELKRFNIMIQLDAADELELDVDALMKKLEVHLALQLYNDLERSFTVDIDRLQLHRSPEGKDFYIER